jgi:hypothetical protein
MTPQPLVREHLFLKAKAIECDREKIKALRLAVRIARALRIARLCHQGVPPATRLRHGLADAGIVGIFLKYNQTSTTRAA